MILLIHSELIKSKDKLLVVSMFSCITFILGDSRKYVPPILATSSAKRIATQIVVTAQLNERNYFILGDSVSDIIRPSKKLPF